MSAEGSSFEQKVAHVRELYEAWNRGDLELVLRHLAPEVSWQRRPTHPVPGTYEGRSQVASEVFGTVRDQFTELILEPVEFIEHGDHILVRIRQRATGRSSGVPVTGELVHVLRERDGMLVELQGFSTVDEALAALESG
jgi:ketosteroid isomerase-like protein